MKCPYCGTECKETDLICLNCCSDLKSYDPMDYSKNKQDSLSHEAHEVYLDPALYSKNKKDSFEYEEDGYNGVSSTLLFIIALFIPVFGCFYVLHIAGKEKMKRGILSPLTCNSLFISFLWMIACFVLIFVFIAH